MANTLIPGCSSGIPLALMSTSSKLGDVPLLDSCKLGAAFQSGAAAPNSGER